MTPTLAKYGFIALGLSLYMQPAAAYPTKPVRVVSGNQPGGATDIVARAIAARLSDVMGQQFLVDNRPGAGGVIALEVVARATPDGYTLHVCGVGDSIRPATRRILPFDTLRDFTRVSLYGTVPNLLVVHPSVPARTLAEFVALAKANPGKMNYASSGVGFSPHLTMELFKTTAGIDLVHVPYKTGSPNEILAGHVQTQFSNLPTHLGNIKAGKIRPLAITAARRSPTLPDVPTFIESGYPDFEVMVWYGLCGPARIPAAVIAALAAGVTKALEASDFRQRFAELGVQPRPLGGREFEEFFTKEVIRWRRVVKDAGIAPE